MTDELAIEGKIADRVCRNCQSFGACKYTNGRWICFGACRNESTPPQPKPKTLDDILRATSLKSVYVKCSSCQTTMPSDKSYLSLIGEIACAEHAYCECGHLIVNHEYTYDYSDKHKIPIMDHVGKCHGRFKHWSKSKKKIRLSHCKCKKANPITKHLNPDEILPKEAINDPNYRTRTS